MVVEESKVDIVGGSCATFNDASTFNDTNINEQCNLGESTL